jgi:hypothetical protein
MDKQMIKGLSEAMAMLKKTLKEEKKYAEAGLLIIKRTPDSSNTPKPLRVDKMGIIINRANEILRSVELVHAGILDIVEVHEKYNDMEDDNDKKMKEWLKINGL